jgi:hypothetical protein
MRMRLIAAVALTAIAGSAHAEDRRTQMFDDPDMNACWFGNGSGCEAWARLDGNNAMGFICREISRSDRCMPAEQVFDIMLVVNSAETLANSSAAGDPAQNQQNRFWLLATIMRAADRARAARSDAAIEGLRAVIAAIPENIRWDGFRQTLKDKGL